MDDAPETFSHILGVPWKLNFHFGGLQGGGVSYGRRFKVYGRLEPLGLGLREYGLGLIACKQCLGFRCNKAARSGNFSHISTAFCRLWHLARAFEFGVSGCRVYRVQGPTFDCDCR